jgi:hypothetical protein
MPVDSIVPTDPPATLILAVQVSGVPQADLRALQSTQGALPWLSPLHRLHYTAGSRAKVAAAVAERMRVGGHQAGDLIDGSVMMCHFAVTR